MYNSFSLKGYVNLFQNQISSCWGIKPLFRQLWRGQAPTEADMGQKGNDTGTQKAHQSPVYARNKLNRPQYLTAKSKWKLFFLWKQTKKKKTYSKTDVIHSHTLMDKTQMLTQNAAYLQCLQKVFTLLKVFSFFLCFNCNLYGTLWYFSQIYVLDQHSGVKRQW